MDNIQLTKQNFIIKNRLSISSDIRKFREKKGFSQEQLAALMGISRATISKIENGKFAISIDYISKFAWHLDFNFKIFEKQCPETNY